MDYKKLNDLDLTSEFTSDMSLVGVTASNTKRVSRDAVIDIIKEESQSYVDSAIESLTSDIESYVDSEIATLSSSFYSADEINAFETNDKVLVSRDGTPKLIDNSKIGGGSPSPTPTKEDVWYTIPAYINYGFGSSSFAGILTDPAVIISNGFIWYSEYNQEELRWEDVMADSKIPDGFHGRVNLLNELRYIDDSMDEPQSVVKSPCYVFKGSDTGIYNGSNFTFDPEDLSNEDLYTDLNDPDKNVRIRLGVFGRFDDQLVNPNHRSTKFFNDLFIELDITDCRTYEATNDTIMEYTGSTLTGKYDQNWIDLINHSYAFLDSGREFAVFGDSYIGPFASMRLGDKVTVLSGTVDDNGRSILMDTFGASDKIYGSEGPYSSQGVDKFNFIYFDSSNRQPE